MNPAFAVLGWPDDGPTLRLDHRAFAYAGKFVMSSTGKAVACDPSRLDDPDWPPDAREARADGVVAAVSFDADRADPRTARLRYVTVRADRRGEGVGARLAAFVADRLRAAGYDRVRIAVNNPFAFEALHKAGFGYAGEETGLAELVLERPAPPDHDERYREGLGVFRDRDLSEAEEAFLADRDGPPARIDPPAGVDLSVGADRPAGADGPTDVESTADADPPNGGN